MSCIPFDPDFWSVTRVLIGFVLSQRTKKYEDRPTYAKLNASSLSVYIRKLFNYIIPTVQCLFKKVLLLCISFYIHVYLQNVDYKNLPRLCAGTGKSTRVSKICSPRRGLPSRGRCKSLTRGWISLSLYKVVVDYFSPTALNPHDKTLVLLSKSTSKRFLVRKRRQLGLIMTSRHCMIYDVTRCPLKRNCLYRGR